MNRKDVVYTVLGGFFLTNALIAELIGGKIIPLFGGYSVSAGILPWPVVFVATDLINEYFGKRGVRRLTFLTLAMIGYAFIILFATMPFPAIEDSPIDNASYNRVFGAGRWIIIGSMTAFLVSQLVDVLIFHVFRKKTGKALLWLRATGSTIVSQLIDSGIVLYIGVALPKEWTFTQFINTAIPNYTIKLVVAILMTPFIYLGHWAVERYLGKPQAEAMAESAARASESAEPEPA